MITACARSYDRVNSSTSPSNRAISSADIPLSPACTARPAHPLTPSRALGSSQLIFLLCTALRQRVIAEEGGSSPRRPATSLLDLKLRLERRPTPCIALRCLKFVGPHTGRLRPPAGSSLLSLSYFRPGRGHH